MKTLLALMAVALLTFSNLSFASNQDVLVAQTEISAQSKIKIPTELTAEVGTTAGTATAASGAAVGTLSVTTIAIVTVAVVGVAVAIKETSNDNSTVVTAPVSAN